MTLLDTHALYWLCFAPHRLGKSTRHRLGRGGLAYYSPLSLAELSMKALQGRLQLPPEFPSLVTEQGLTSLPFQDRHAAALDRFAALAGHDPLDWMLLAQAAADRLDLVTADRRLLSLGLGWVVDATT